MKKVAGTLKLDQAQFRELEAFSKFGSDLDASTKRTIERGRINQEILKQPQFSPSPVEQQVAIIYASTTGLMDGVPTTRVKEFQKEFATLLSANHKDTLAALRAGKLDDNVIGVLKQVASDTAKRYRK
jgi:F-type H+-transporting ATPase subunit alpha